MYHLLLNRFMLPVVLRCTSSKYPKLARQSAKRQYWSNEKIRDWQLKHINDTIAHAAAHIPYYRDRFDGLPSKLRTLESLREYPSLTKAEVSSNFPDRIVSAAADRSEIRWRGTGGTTQRIVVADNFLKRDHMRAAAQLAFSEDCNYQQGRKAVSIPPDACSALCATDGLRETTVLRHLTKMVVEGRISDAEARSDLRGLVMNNWIECRTILEPFGPEGTHIDDERMQSYVDRLRAMKPYLLKALPEYLMGIARYAKATKQALPRIPIVKPMGAIMTPVMKQRVQDVFGTRVREDYGCNDLGPLGFECSCGGLHLLTDHFYFEFERADRPADDGELAALLVTDLHNLAMPLIRYRLGDLVRVDRTSCPCGRKSPRIVIAGRKDDLIMTSGGNWITTRDACEVFFSHPQIEAFQLIERSERRFELKCVAKGDVREDELLAGFSRSTGDLRRVQIRQVDTIAPETSGKFRYLRSRSAAGWEPPAVCVPGSESVPAGDG